MTRRRWWNKRYSDQWKNAVCTLEALADTEGSEHAWVAAIEALAERQRAKWAESRSLKRTSGRECIARLLGRRCQVIHRDSDEHEIPHQPPYADHSRLWIGPNGSMMYTTEPYGVSLDQMREIVAFCDRYGFDVRVDPRAAWHFPGGTEALVYTKRDDGLAST